ncbi:MAG: hypothetical protein Q7K57_40175 [Burkholderiaceae bacterium]|nr:hypothetical protein [Burkholderiaceae bacterium]
MSTTTTVIIMGLVVVSIGALASLWPAPMCKKQKDDHDKEQTIISE